MLLEAAMLSGLSVFPMALLSPFVCSIHNRAAESLSIPTLGLEGTFLNAWVTRLRSQGQCKYWLSFLFWLEGGDLWAAFQCHTLGPETQNKPGRAGQADVMNVIHVLSPRLKNSSRGAPADRVS